MYNNKLTPVILAGGKGERFWPLSRLKHPKQFLSLDGSGESLLQTTANRLLKLADGWENLFIITSELLAEGVQRQLPLLPPENILVEPMPKDTAPAVTWASLEIQSRYGEGVIAGFFPADHYIGNQEQFEKIITIATKYAQEKQGIITLGIKPDYPATGYGYIEQGEIQGKIEDIACYHVTRFTEKPDEKTAEEFIATNRYSWNSGMFIFPVAVVLKELNQHAQQILQPLQAEGKSAYPQLDKISIDYALMEKTKLAYVIPAEFNWDDLGDWNALERLLTKENDNILVGDSLNQDSKNNIIYNNQSAEIIMTIGVEDLVIVREGNATLIANKKKTQDIKKALKLLQEKENSSDFL